MMKAGGEADGGRALTVTEASSLKRQVRLVGLLDAANSAGLTPMRILRLHAFAYLSNVLAPVWTLDALEGTVLKRRGGPFYPSLQRDLDRLVGMGVVSISNLGHVKDEEGRWRLEGQYNLNYVFAQPILQRMTEEPDESWTLSFLEELAYALSALTDEELDRAVAEDATYSDNAVSYNNVVDFDEWRETNYSANAARRFQGLLPGGVTATPGEKIHLYVMHLQRRINGGH